MVSLKRSEVLVRGCVRTYQRWNFLLSVRTVSARSALYRSCRPVSRGAPVPSPHSSRRIRRRLGPELAAVHVLKGLAPFAVRAFGEVEDLTV